MGDAATGLDEAIGSSGEQTHRENGHTHHLFPSLQRVARAIRMRGDDAAFVAGVHRSKDVECLLAAAFVDECSPSTDLIALEPGSRPAVRSRLALPVVRSQARSLSANPRCQYPAAGQAASHFYDIVRRRAACAHHRRQFAGRRPLGATGGSYVRPHSPPWRFRRSW